MSYDGRLDIHLHPDDDHSRWFITVVADGETGAEGKSEGVLQLRPKAGQPQAKAAVKSMLGVKVIWKAMGVGAWSALKGLAMVENLDLAKLPILDLPVGADETSGTLDETAPLTNRLASHPSVPNAKPATGGLDLSAFTPVGASSAAHALPPGQCHITDKGAVSLGMTEAQFAGIDEKAVALVDVPGNLLVLVSPEVMPDEKPFKSASAAKGRRVRFNLASAIKAFGKVPKGNYPLRREPLKDPSKQAVVISLKNAI